jgi:hypothetical protein
MADKQKQNVKTAGAVAAPAIAAAKATKTVTVACKMPSGLLLRIFKMVDQSVQVMGGGSRIEKQAEQIGKAVKINGYASPFGKAPKHTVLEQTYGGYGLTPGVDAEFFAKWMHDNAESDLVKNRIVFAASDSDRVEAEADDYKKEWDGMHPITPDTDKRIPRGVKTADEQKKPQAAA